MAKIKHIPAHTRRTKSGVVRVSAYTAYTATMMQQMRKAHVAMNGIGGTRSINKEMRRRAQAGNARARQIQATRASVLKRY